MKVSVVIREVVVVIKGAPVIKVGWSGESLASAVAQPLHWSIERQSVVAALIGDVAVVIERMAVIEGSDRDRG